MFPLHLNDPAYLWALLVLPVLLWWARREKRTRAAFRLPTLKVLRAAGTGFKPKLMPALWALRVAGLVLVVLALARPQVRDERAKDASVEGIDIVIALDLSISMEAGDFRPNNRLHVAKQVLSEFISARTNDRIGLVVFAGAAYTQAPLTLDYNVLKEVVRQLRTRVIEDGTAIGDALAVSLNRLRESEAKSRVVVLITDGDNNAGMISPLDAASMAESLGVPIYTILVGKGGVVPLPAGTDLFGNTVWREMNLPVNPELLEDISSRTGGESYRATDKDTLLSSLNKVLDSLERSKLMEGGATAKAREVYHPFLLWAFVLLGLDLFLRSTWLRVFP